MTKSRSNRDGLDLVFETIRTQQELPLHYGPKAFLARHLCISRQAVTYWQNTGRIPQEYVASICKLTGLSEEQIRPEDVAVNIPSDLFYRITARAARTKKTFTDVLVASLRKDFP